MFLGVILFCYQPYDAFSCSITARTGGLFYSEQECKATVSREMTIIAKTIKAVAKAKCFEVGQAT